MLALPCLPEHQHGEAEDEKENKALGVHASGHGIVAARMPRPAAAKALRDKQTAATSAVAFEGFFRVLRAGRMETAGRWQERAYEPAIASDE